MAELEDDLPLAVLVACRLFVDDAIYVFDDEDGRFAVQGIVVEPSDLSLRLIHHAAHEFNRLNVSYFAYRV